MREPFTEDQLRLIHGLQVAPRASWSELGAAIEVSPRRASRMYAELAAEHDLWVTAAVGPTLLGSVCMAFVDLSCEPARIRDVAAQLAKDPHVITVQLMSGDWDIGCLALYRDVDSAVDPLLDGFGAIDGVTQVRSSLASHVLDASNFFRLQALSPAAVDRLTSRTPGGSAEMPPLDRLDLDLVDHLAQDGRAPTANLAAQLDVSPRTVERRINRLVSSGRIVLRCDFSRPRAGIGTAVAFRLRIPDEQLFTVGRSLLNLPETRTCAVLATTPNFFWSVGVPSMASVQLLKTRVARMLPDVEVVDQMIVLRQGKLYGRILDDAGSWRSMVPFVSELIG